MAAADDGATAAAAAQKRQQLAALRAQVVALELELASNAAAAPAATPDVAPGAAPQFEHVEYRSFTGNLGVDGLGWQRPADPAALSTPELVASRAYARNLEIDSVAEVIAGCSDSLRRYGFCVVDHVVPRDQVDAVYHELSDEQEAKLAALTPEEKQRPGPDGKPRGMAFLSPTLQPLFSAHVCHPAVVGIAQTVLDNHVRIAQSAQRNVASDDQAGDGVGGFGPLENRGPLGREWHTDWPHDLYQGPNGAIRQPFADIAMCLSMVWYMTDVDEDSGGTFCVPGAHRDTRNPRGPTDGITVPAPIPGDMQVRAPAGSVFIQDSRMWHSTACHNVSRKLRVAGQNRWVPWWFNESYCANAAGENGPGENGWVSLEEWEGMPEGLKPLMAHRCHALGWDVTQEGVRTRAEAAAQRNSWGFDRVGEPGLHTANEHIVVKVAKL